MNKLDYCRGKPNVSLKGLSCLWITVATLAAGAALDALPSQAQYPGQITNANKDAPDLRAVAVLEWTGDADHPKASRLVPVCIYDGQQLQDAGLYLAHPEPLALEGEVEYQLQQDGKPVGLFQVENSGREQGAWIGMGKLKPLPRPKPAPAQIAKVDEDDAQSDEPILHRKHPAGDAGGSGSGSDSGSSGAPPDPDRPTLHKSPDASSNGSGDSGNSGSDSSTAPDPDRPTLHKSTDSSSSNASAGGSDSPKLKKKKDDDEAYVEDVETSTDPDRPHLNRGKSAGVALAVLPSLMGLPPEMMQEVAVSDVKNRPVHPWDYSWASPDDEAKMKAALEDLARTALGLNPPPAPAVAKHTPTVAHRTTKPAPPPPPPAPLLDEQFHVFELAYGTGATMVLTAHTDGSAAPEKSVTLVGQPDLYGNVAVLLKNVSDGAHLDETPRLRLVDAVDAMADNRGELLFELRGQTQRQFALYRVLRGSATRIFLSGADAIGASNN
jgi:hypothetical protein